MYSTVTNNKESFSSLKSHQKEAIGLLSIGTFLEYFDLMLYIHMAVFLNKLFFPITKDTQLDSLFAAVALCTTFVFRPLGALFFGYIGDHIGRKATVILTTLLMAISCIIMANLPTYEQIGIFATWILTMCRITQGISSMGESIGAELYLTETIKPPAQYPAVALVSVVIALGTMAALGVAAVSINGWFDWRNAFWIGAGVALVGGAARTALRETPDFVNAKRRIQLALEKTNYDPKIATNNPLWKEKVNKKTALSLFLIQCSWPACFYVAYFYCANILTISFKYNSEQVIYHNFFVSVVQLLGIILLTFLSYKVYPIIIVRIKLIIFSIFTLLCPILLNNIDSPLQLFLFQSCFITFTSCSVPAVPIFFQHFPTLKRFTYTSVSYALSRALTYIVTSFGFVYLTKYFNHWGLLVILVPINLGFSFGLSHFEKLEKEAVDLIQESDDKNYESQELYY